MTRPIAGKRKQKIVAHAPPVEVARLSRYDYAVATGSASQAAVATARTARQAAATAGAILSPDKCFDMNMVITEPLQVSVAMHTSYAADLLRRLRGAKKPRRGECHQISVDCPVEIVVDSTMLVALIDKLEGEIGSKA